MKLDQISIKENMPDQVPVIIEVAQGSDPVKYEYDKDADALFVDRFIPVAMSYPANYGFVPHTKSGDGDACDVLVLTEYPLMPGSVIMARPIGVLQMEDEGGQDEKILAVPISKLTPLYDDIKNAVDLPEIIRKRIEHFFTRYKDLEPSKWVKISGWKDADSAKKILSDSVI